MLQLKGLNHGEWGFLREQGKLVQVMFRTIFFIISGSGQGTRTLAFVKHRFRASRTNNNFTEK